MGVGTLIVFIAMVLVAAVAAAVIIGTSGSLQQRAMATGQEATQEVSSNLHLVGLYGQRNTTSDDIWTMKLLLTLSAGSQKVDLNQTIVRYSDGDSVRIYRHDAVESGFTLTWIRGSDTQAVAEGGDLIEMTFDLVDREVAPRERFDLQLIQVVGAPVLLEVRTPPTYGTDLEIGLR